MKSWEKERLFGQASMGQYSSPVLGMLERGKMDPVSQSYFPTNTVHNRAENIPQKETGKCIIHNLNMPQLEIQIVE